MYDYREAIKEDIKNYIDENFSCYDLEGLSRDDIHEKLYEDLWIEDSVTGNASGSYTFNRYEAGENLCGNFDLLTEALEEFGGNVNEISKGEEFCDVTIRCYLLSEVLNEVLDEDDRF